MKKYGLPVVVYADVPPMAETHLKPDKKKEAQDTSDMEATRLQQQLPSLSVVEKSAKGICPNGSARQEDESDESTHFFVKSSKVKSSFERTSLMARPEPRVPKLGQATQQLSTEFLTREKSSESDKLGGLHETDTNKLKPSSSPEVLVVRPELSKTSYLARQVLERLDPQNSIEKRHNQASGLETSRGNQEKTHFLSAPLPNLTFDAGASLTSDLSKKRVESEISQETKIGVQKEIFFESESPSPPSTTEAAIDKPPLIQESPAVPSIPAPVFSSEESAFSPGVAAFMPPLPDRSQGITSSPSILAAPASQKSSSFSFDFSGFHEISVPDSQISKQKAGDSKANSPVVEQVRLTNKNKTKIQNPWLIVLGLAIVAVSGMWYFLRPSTLAPQNSGSPLPSESYASTVLGSHPSPLPSPPPLSSSQVVSPIVPSEIKISGGQSGSDLGDAASPSVFLKDIIDPTGSSGPESSSSTKPSQSASPGSTSTVFQTPTRSKGRDSQEILNVQDQTKRPASGSGFITVMTTPACEGVWIDGHSAGACPVFKKSVSPGAHLVKIKTSDEMRVNSVLVNPGETRLVR